MRVLSVSPEVFPLVKTGGLADVAGALPPALGRCGINVTTLMPGYPAVMSRIKTGSVLHEYDALLGAKAALVAADVEGLSLIVLDAPELFDRAGGPYSDVGGKDYADNWRRFAALSRSAADIGGGLLAGFAPDLLHLHDWQSALAAAYMKYYGIERPTVVTIHNLAFQGHFPGSIFTWIELPSQAFSVDGVEYYGGVGFLKAGLQCASAITTVSPTYAEEIRTPDFGMGLDGLINSRADALHGIVNGIDTTAWDPETDPYLTQNFSAKKLKGRTANRASIEHEFGLDRDHDPIFCVVSRLTWQKGMDLLVDVIDDVIAIGGKLAVLGSGDMAIEGTLLAQAARHRGRIGVVIGYNEPLSHLLQGGADAILIPSRFEPCGLTQLYGLRYGCVPVVGRTGGLADTVIDANTAALSAGVATGLQFSQIDAAGLRRAMRRAIDLFREPTVWTAMQRQGMKSDVSWDRSAQRYAALFRSLVGTA